MSDRILACQRGKVWLPDEYLTTVADNCSRGRFLVTRAFTFPCTLLPTGNIFIDEQEGVELPISVRDEQSDGVRLGDIRCATCGGEVEIRSIELKVILDELRSREIRMKQSPRDPSRTQAASDAGRKGT